MAWFFNLPLNVRLALMFLIGMVVGGQVNRAIYAWAWKPRPIGPWTTKHKEAPERKWWDRIPIVGWFGLAREEKVHGKLYWLRPMLIEVGMAIGFAMLYQWEMFFGLHDWPFPLPAVGVPVLHWEFLSHTILISLLMIGTFVDFDEQAIPDLVTIPGMLIGFFLATVAPNSLLPAIRVTALKPLTITEPFLDPAIPFPWTARWEGVTGLLVALLCLVGWWYALVPKTIYYKRGVAKWFAFLVTSIFRPPRNKKAPHWAVWLAGLTLIIMAWTVIAWFWGGAHWRGLFTSIIGMAFGVILVWSFRLVATTALNQEALGFGDVTLMGMIGAFVGWQPCILIFFLAPFAGMIIGILKLLLTGRNDIAYGPYLSLATLMLILYWTPIWSTVQDYYFLGYWIPVGIVVALIWMAVMLSVYVWIKRKLGFGLEEQ